MRLTGSEIARCEAGDEHIDDLAPLLQEAGKPYYDWFFGGAEPARGRLREWMARPSSEISVRRVTLFTVEDRIIGGAIGLAGSDVERCRAADALAAVAGPQGPGRAETIGRMRTARGLFAPVEPDVFYGSKLWCIPSLRGRGYGAKMLREYFEMGEEQGFRRFGGDVWAGNRTALKLYETYGFRVTGETEVPEAGLHYVSIIRET
jgi:RimJ/RimL family protein N-acetyltransferase